MAKNLTMDARSSGAGIPPEWAERIDGLVRPLLRWFSHNARDLPWRRTLDPYAIWISEIMLQQTQVKTVIPYWERWLRAFPNIAALAKARPEKLLKLWEGLGYYTRVRNLHKAAQFLARECKGQFPARFADVLQLPGIGRYTAGAICSIAFNQPQPILDGNTIRVLCRIFGWEENPREKNANQRLWKLAEALVLKAAQAKSCKGALALKCSAGNCSQLNQSLMELGAMICLPRNPDCRSCPVRAHCVALHSGKVMAIPNLGQRVEATSRRFLAFVVEHDGRYLIQQRPVGVVNAQLWEFPNVEVAEGPNGVTHVFRRLFNVSPMELRHFHTVKHSITRYRITLEGHYATVKECPPYTGMARWVTRAKLSQFAFPSAHRKLLDRLE